MIWYSIDRKFNIQITINTRPAFVGQLCPVADYLTYEGPKVVWIFALVQGWAGDAIAYSCA